jgi:hypothetical protein
MIATEEKGGKELLWLLERRGKKAMIKTGEEKEDSFDCGCRRGEGKP